MPKTRAQKEQTVERLTEHLKKMKSVVFANFDKVSVKEVDALRKEAREKDIHIIVAKKNLLKRALNNANLENLSDYHYEGGVASFFAMSDETAGARLIEKVGKTSGGLQMLGGIIEGEYYNREHIMQIATLPSKGELMGMFARTIAAPLYNFAYVLSGVQRQLLTVLSNLQATKK